MICILFVLISSLPWLTYTLCHEPIPFYAIFLAIVGAIISGTLQGKVILDVVHNRQQNMFEYPLSLIQAFLMQAVALILCYGVAFVIVNIATEDFRVYQLLIFVLLYFLVRLQFAAIYILEKHCSIAQSVHSSWLLTKHNNSLLDRFFLSQVAVMILYIFFLSSLDWNLVVFMMPFVGIGTLPSPMQIRMFKELEK